MEGQTKRLEPLLEDAPHVCRIVRMFEVLRSAPVDGWSGGLVDGQR
jgi:hypothetical protein